MIEKWRPIRGFEGFYEVSDLGRVRSLARVIYRTDGVRQTLRERILAAASSAAGYEMVTLRNVTVDRHAYVHQLVAEAFLGPRPEGHEVRHLDGDPTNNAKSNLTYGTHRENMLDKKVHGTEYQSNWTHCSAGHEYNEINTRTDDRGRRWCRPCHRERNREYRERRRARAA